MKRKNLILGIALCLICILMCVAVVACGNRADNSHENKGNGTQQPTAAPTEQPTVTPTEQPTERPTEAPVTTCTVNTYSNTDNYGQAGEFTLLTNKMLNIGDRIELSATVNDGYNFEGWYMNGGLVSTEKEFTLTVTANVRVEARYNYYTVTTMSYSDREGLAGTYTELNAKKVSVGNTVTVTATVNDGYNFEGWYINGECVSNELEYTLKMRAQNASLEARYSSYTVTTDGNTFEGNAGSFTQLDHKKYSVGSTVTLVATVNDGYNFEGWYINYECVSNELEYTMEMKADDVVIEARYSCYTVTTDGRTFEGMAGSFTQLERKPYSIGSTVTLVATVSDGYTFEGWHINGVRVSDELEYSFEMTAEDIYVEAIYECYTLTTSGITYKGDGQMGGTFTLYQDKKIAAGTSITLVATVQEGFNFVGWFVDDELISTELQITAEMPHGNIEIVAVYNCFFLDVYAGYGNNGFYPYGLEVYGCVENLTSANQRISIGQEVTLVAKQIEGYVFDGWYLGEVLVSSELEITFEMPDMDVSLTVGYQKID